MDEGFRKTSIGSPDGIQFEFRWVPAPDQSLEGLGWGHGVLRICNQIVWASGSEDELPIAWTWADFLAFLGRNWLYLKLEQQYPLDLSPQSPWHLRQALEEFWSAEEPDDDTRFAQDEEVSRFEHRHDLANGLRGIFLPSVILLREGELTWVATENFTAQLDLADVLNVLEAAGNEIQKQLADSTHPRAIAAVKKWSARGVPKNDEHVVRILTGLSQSEAVILQSGADTREYWGVTDSWADNEIFAAARMSRGSLSLYQQAQVLDIVRNIPKRAIPYLDALSDKARQVLDALKAEKLYVQGYEAACWFREQLTYSIEQKFDPLAWLAANEIDVLELKFDDATEFEAVACWGPSHGPSILYNASGRFSSTIQGRNATFAHEIAHLIMDRRGVRPLVDVISGSSGEPYEKRARAFAAELLLPREVAAGIYQRSTSIREAIQRLTLHYQVGKELAAWQLRNSQVATSFSPEDRSYIKSLTRKRSAIASYS